MGKTWHGGKGSDNRVSNHRAYWDSPLWKKKDGNILEGLDYLDPVEEKTPKYIRKEKKFLFLDDIRTPQTAFLWDEKKTLHSASGVSNYKWDIVRDYQQFVDYIDTNGIPEVISFDNDLFDVTDHSVSNEVLIKQFAMDDWENFEIKTGAHCAKYVVKKCKELGVKIPKYYVHSANNTARPIIRKIMEDGKL